MKLTTNQLVAIELGMRKRKGLIRQTKRMAKKVTSETSKYVDQLIAGPSGTGKTYNILKTLRNENLPFHEMTGNASIFGFMGNLMYLHHCKPAGEKLVIFLDDCDFLFETKNVNLLKNLTATNPQDRKFTYTKSINTNAFTEAQQQILDFYTHEGTHGLTIPCSDFVFIIASNIELPNETQLDEMTNAQKIKANHLLAIRGRMKPYDFELTKEEKWGWIYDAGINDGALDMIEDQDDKLFLLDWMWSNWDKMKETSIRTIEKMAEDMVEDPEDFKEYWELDYLVK